MTMDINDNFISERFKHNVFIPSPIFKSFDNETNVTNMVSTINQLINYIGCLELHINKLDFKINMLEQRAKPFNNV